MVHTAESFNILGGSLRYKENVAEALVIDINDTGLEVNAEKTKYMSIWSYLEIRMQDKMGTDRQVINPKYRKFHSRIRGMLAFIRCRIFGLPACYPKM